MVPLYLFLDVGWRDFPWWSSGWNSILPMQRAQVQSLVGELDSACHSWRSHTPKLRPGTANKKEKMWFTVLHSQCRCTPSNFCPLGEKKSVKVMCSVFWQKVLNLRVLWVRTFRWIWVRVSSLWEWKPQRRVGRAPRVVYSCGCSDGPTLLLQGLIWASSSISTRSLETKAWRCFIFVHA